MTPAILEHASNVTDEPRRVQWTRADIPALEDSGVLDLRRVELIEGELIDKMGKKPPHIDGVNACAIRMLEVFGRGFVYWESPIDVAPQDNPRNEPEPDVVIFRSRRIPGQPLPGPADIALLIEVSDTTLRFDRTVKARLYARADIAEYWVLDVVGRRLTVFRDPVDGQYRSRVELEATESIAPLCRPDTAITVESLLAS